MRPLLFLWLPADTYPQVVVLVDCPNSPDVHHVSVTSMSDDGAVNGA